MKITDLTEDAEDLQRKIVALQAMINDKATTDGEKDNARTLLQKVQARLKAEYPNYMPSASPKPAAKPSYDPNNDWMYNMAKAYSAARDKENEEIKLYGKPMNVNAMLRGKGENGQSYTWTEEEVMPFVKQLMYKANVLRKRHVSGDSDRPYEEFYDKARRLVNKWCPVEKAKRYAKAKASSAASDKRRQEKFNKKEAAYKKATAKSGITFKQAKEELGDDILNRLNNAMVGTVMGASTRSWVTGKPAIWSKDELRYIFGSLRSSKGTSIQEGLSKLSKEDVKKIYDVISRIATTGGEYAYTEAQKKFVLGAFKRFV